MKKLNSVMTFIFFILVPFLSQADELPHNSLCVVPVKNSVPTSEDANATWRILDRVIAFPSMAHPIIYPQLRKGIWTISDQRELILYNDDPKKFPSGSFWDQYWYDEAAHKIFGNDNSYKIYQFDQGTGKFEQLLNTAEMVPEKSKYVFRTTYIPALHKIIFAGNVGLWELADDNVIPFLPDELQHEVGQVKDVKDLPSFKGMILFGEKPGGFWGLEKKVYFLSYDKKLYQTSIKKSGRKNKIVDHSEFTDARETYPIQKVLITGTYEDWFLRGKDAYLLDMSFDAKTGYYPASAKKIKPFHSEVKYAPPSITTNKYKAFVGDRKIYLFNKEDMPFTSSDGVSIKRIESRNTYIATVGNKLYVADNDKFVRPPIEIPEARLGIYFLYDLPSIKRVLLRAGSDLYELSSDYQFQSITWDNIPHRVINVAEMPKSNLAVVIAEEGLFALGTNGLPMKIRNQSTKPQIAFGPSHKPTLLQSQELLIGAQDQIYLVVDEKISGLNCNQ